MASQDGVDTQELCMQTHFQRQTGSRHLDGGGLAYPRCKTVACVGKRAKFVAQGSRLCCWRLSLEGRQQGGRPSPRHAKGRQFTC
mmetsp:Transcript_27604/g.65496  ORF Transcript_27604/g.65496 Transcript_27604/m.65496 type:complete len:85 (+) Transcript_27604:159-413(+)